jgi:NADP-dependent 3-hydroxy acid dehydrogenase YdfG
VTGASSGIGLVSSMSGRRVPSAAGGVYAATKAAVHAVGETLRMEVGERGVHVPAMRGIGPGDVGRSRLGDGRPRRPGCRAMSGCRP